MVEAVGEQNEIEATSGTGKQIYRANNMRAKLLEAANCWTGMCYFVKNVMRVCQKELTKEPLIFRFHPYQAICRGVI